MRLAEYLEERGESQTAFAKRCKIAQQTVNRISVGAVRPRIDHADKIIEATRDEPAPCGGTVTLQDLREAYTG